MKRSLLLIIIVMLALPVFAGGGREMDQSSGVAIPAGPEKPKLPVILMNENDFQLVLDAYDQLIDSMDPLIESLVYNGLEANKEPLDQLRDVTEWWRDYISSLKIRGESPKVRSSEIDDFLSSLLARDQQFQKYLDEVNRIIELDNEDMS